MNKLEIRKGILEIVKQHSNELIETYINTYELKSFHLMSANLLRLFPGINLERHKYIYKRLMVMRMLENITQYFKTIDLDNFFKNLPPEKFCYSPSAIYISYHIGAYRMAILPMVKYNIDIVLVVDTSVYTIEQIERELNSHFNIAKEIFPSSTSKFVILSANSKDTVIELMSKINQGYSILTYIDWNSGYNDKNNNGNITIDFMNEKTRVKQSIAYLSYYTKRPIIPFLSYFGPNFEPNWILFESISPSNFSTIHEYSFYSMQKMYSNLEFALKKFYSQWEGLFHIHRFMLLDDKSNSTKKEFDSNLTYKINKYAGLFSLMNVHFIIDKISYKILRLPQELFNILSTDDPIKNGMVDLSTLEQLYNKGMLEVSNC